MKLWVSNPNLHLSLVDTTIWLPFCFLVCLFILWLVMSHAICYACHVNHAYLLYAFFICSLHLFLPLLVY